MATCEQLRCPPLSFGVPWDPLPHSPLGRYVALRKSWYGISRPHICSETETGVGPAMNPPCRTMWGGKEKTQLEGDSSLKASYLIVIRRNAEGMPSIQWSTVRRKVSPPTHTNPTSCRVPQRSWGSLCNRRREPDNGRHSCCSLK